MNIDIEIIGKLENVEKNIIGIQLYIKNKPISYFSINIERKKILGEMNNATKTLLNIEDTFEDYIKLIKELEIENVAIYYIKNIGCPNPVKNFFILIFGVRYLGIMFLFLVVMLF